MRFPIWREGGAYGGCRDCFDAQLVEMVDTRALGADDARKKAWVDARTYESVSYTHLTLPTKA